MEKQVRIGKVEDQDRLRREDVLRMTPAERVAALLCWRDRQMPRAPIERVATTRPLQ